MIRIILILALLILEVLMPPTTRTTRYQAPKPPDTRGNTPYWMLAAGGGQPPPPTAPATSRNENMDQQTTRRGKRGTGPKRTLPWMQTGMQTAPIPAWLQGQGLNQQTLTQQAPSNANREAAKPTQLLGVPAWMMGQGNWMQQAPPAYPTQQTPTGTFIGGGGTQVQGPSGGGISVNNPTSYVGEDGRTYYLQPDGTYAAPWSTAGVGTDSTRNAFTSLPLYRQTQPLADQSSQYYGFGSRYNWGRRGGGGRGGGYSPYTPAWMMGLNSWNFGE